MGTRLAAVVLLLAFTVSCRTLSDHPVDSDSDLLGVVVGNGSGDYLREPAPWPEVDKVVALLSRLRTSEPALVAIMLDDAITAKKVKPWRIVKLAQSEDPNAARQFEPCYLSTNQGAEIRAVYRNNTITMCRLFYYQAPAFTESTKSSMQVATVLHELMHYVYGVTGTESDDEEGEVQMLEYYFRLMAEAPDDKSFVDAAAGLRSLLTEDIPALRDPSVNSATEARIGEVYWQDAAKTEPYMKMIRTTEGMEYYQKGAHYFLNLKAAPEGDAVAVMTKFLEKAPKTLILKAAGHPDVRSEVYGGTYTDSSFGIFMHAIYIGESEYTKMEAKVPYSIEPENSDAFANKWLIPLGMTVMKP